MNIFVYFKNKKQRAKDRERQKYEAMKEEIHRVYREEFRIMEHRLYAAAGEFIHVVANELVYDNKTFSGVSDDDAWCIMDLSVAIRSNHKLEDSPRLLARGFNTTEHSRNDLIALAYSLICGGRESFYIHNVTKLPDNEKIK